MKVAVLAVDGMLDSGLALVLDVLGTANALSSQLEIPEPPFTVSCVGVRDSITTSHGLSLATTPVHTLAERPEVFITPALGLRSGPDIVAAVRNHATLGVIAQLCADGVGMAAACSGTFFLAEAGILDGITATTSWWLGPAFRHRYPRVDLDESRALSFMDNITTAGAAFAHIDLALSLVARCCSPELAELVARYLVVGDRPSQAAVALPSVLAGGDPTLSAFERHVRENLDNPLSIAAIAHSIGASERTLQRLTESAMGMSPIRFIQEIRLDQATYLLRTTTRSAQAIAAAVGYQNVGTLRTLVRRRRGTTLAALRAGDPAARQRDPSRGAPQG